MPEVAASGNHIVVADNYSRRYERCHETGRDHRHQYCVIEYALTLCGREFQRRYRNAVAPELAIQFAKDWPDWCEECLQAFPWWTAAGIKAWQEAGYLGGDETLRLRAADEQQFSSGKGLPPETWDALSEEAKQERADALARWLDEMPVSTIAEEGIMMPANYEHTKADMDATPRKCGCGATFRISDYPAGYFAYRYQIRKGSTVNTCPSCEKSVYQNVIDGVLPDGNPWHYGESTIQSAKEELAVLNGNARMTRQANVNPSRYYKPNLVSELGNHCQGCGRYYDDDRVLEVDHIQPRREGGSDDYDNLTLLCPPCNRAKGFRLTLEQLQSENRESGHLPKEREVNIRHGKPFR